jgi:hypothetical protein
MPVDLVQPRPLCLEQLKRSALRRHLHEIQAAARRPGASKFAHYLAARGGGVCALAGSVFGSSAAALASGGPSPAAHRVALAGRGDGKVEASAPVHSVPSPIARAG